MLNVAIRKEWYDEIKNLVKMKNEYFYTDEFETEFVEVDVDVFKEYVSSASNVPLFTLAADIVRWRLKIQLKGIYALDIAYNNVIYRTIHT